MLIQIGVFCFIIFVYTLVGHYMPLFEGTLNREEEEAKAQPGLQRGHARA
jgi:hypothetical protein